MCADQLINFFLIWRYPQLKLHLSRDGIPANNWIQGRVLREFSPEEVTANIYTMVDVLLHHIHLELQRGHPLQV